MLRAVRCARVWVSLSPGPEGRSPAFPVPWRSAPLSATLTFPTRPPADRCSAAERYCFTIWLSEGGGQRRPGGAAGSGAGLEGERAELRRALSSAEPLGAPGHQTAWLPVEAFAGWLLLPSPAARGLLCTADRACWPAQPCPALRRPLDLPWLASLPATKPVGLVARAPLSRLPSPTRPALPCPTCRYRRRERGLAPCLAPRAAQACRQVGAPRRVGAQPAREPPRGAGAGAGTADLPPGGRGDREGAGAGAAGACCGRAARRAAAPCVVLMCGLRAPGMLPGRLQAGRRNLGWSRCSCRPLGSFVTQPGCGASHRSSHV